jgi:hypothetical protein
MKKLILFILVITVLSAGAQIPFPPTPSFETSPQDHYGTGLGIADINGDGWKDIIVANGNDIQRQRLVVYYNQGDGTFPLLPDWQSADVDYHGHLSAGDIDNDGDVDIAVSVYLGPGGFGDKGKAKIYYNTGTQLESTPSFETQNFYSFSCALGDADGDGDLDLAVACAEPYGAIYDYGRIFYNNNGVFSSTPGWQSDVQMGAMDVEFGDIDQNGFLDLMFVCESTDNYVFLADNNGVIDETHDWHSDNAQNFMNSLDFGKVHNSAPPCMAVTGNDQLGGDGKVKQYNFIPPIPASSGPSWESGYVGYGSGILMAEINNDGYNDLLYGSWWGPLVILEGCCDFWNTAPVYTSDATSVVEAILMSDLGRFNYQPASHTGKMIAESAVITLEQQVIERINKVYVDGVLLDRSEYAYVELKNWVSFKDRLMPGNLVTIEYDHMLNGDIVISNWDPIKGNFIYYNDNNPVGLDEGIFPSGDLLIKNIYPMPACDRLNVVFGPEAAEGITVTLLDLTGKALGKWQQQGSSAMTIDISKHSPGLYLMAVESGKFRCNEKFIISR